MKKNIIFAVFSIFFIISALFHLVAVFVEINALPVWRNLLFVGIDLFVAYGLYTRPPYFIYLFGILFIQQMYTHGTMFVTMWQEQNKIDWISLLVLVFVPVMFVFLLLDKFGKLK